MRWLDSGKASPIQSRAAGTRRWSKFKRRLNRYSVLCKIQYVDNLTNLCYNTLLEKVPSLVLPAEHRMHQRAAGVAMVAAEMIAAGAICDAESMQPNYLRLSQAEREKLEKENKEDK